MRRLKRGRLIKIAAVLVIVILIAAILVYLFSPADTMLLHIAESRGYLKGHVEYCEHPITGDRQIRLALIPYATRTQINGHQIDPNNWKNEPLSHDFMPMMDIIVPYVDYEITQDSGQSWKRFWRYENLMNEGAWCDAFGSLDADNFWVWTRSQIAITHDGGNNWIIQDGYKEWNTGGNMVIQKLVFDSPENGQIVFINWADVPDPTLLTTDGGKTWQPDPNWTAPTE